MNEQQTEGLGTSPVPLASETFFKKHFLTVTTFSKYLALVLFIALPFAGFWLGSTLQSNFGSGSGSQPVKNDAAFQTTKLSTSTGQNGTEPSADSKNMQNPVASNATSSIPDCFPYGGSLDSHLDTSGWGNYDGYGFSTKYPKALVSIEALNNPYGENASDTPLYKITSIRDKNQSATIRVIPLLKSNYSAGYKNLPLVKYELNSDSWWTLSSYGPWAYDKVVQCAPNGIGKTKDGSPIYSTGDGDVGNGYTDYFVVYRDVPDEYGHYEPLVVEFTSTSVGDGMTQEYYDIEKELNNIVQTMVENLKLGPTSKG